MRNGKLAESILRRSVWKTMQTSRKEVLTGSNIGIDSAIISLPPRTTWGGTIQSGSLRREGLDHIILRSVNNLAAAGLEPFTIFLALTLTEDNTEEELKEWIREAQSLCDKLGMQIAGGHTTVVPWVSEPIAAVQGCGRAMANRAMCDGCTAPGEDIVISKWIGLEGTALLAKAYETELLTRYPSFLIKKAQGFIQDMSVLPEAEAAISANVCYMHDVSEGGILGALWEMAQMADVGMEVELQRIPLRQETVEICEFFGISPYELMSGGALLMAARDGGALVAALEELDIKATVIGKFTKGPDRIILNGEEVRYLNRPGMDAIWKIDRSAV
jgi:hydrogenase maturation factor